MQLEVLISKFQQKDQKAFEALYEMYNESMLGVIYNIVRDHDIASELMHDVFMKAWNNAHTYSAEKGRFFTWILNIARNTAIDETRSKTFRNSRKNQDAESFVDILQSSENLERKTDAIGIKKFVEKLAKKCIDVIELIYFKGYTQTEVSETLDIPIGTVKTRNRNCIKDLRTMLDL